MMDRHRVIPYDTIRKDAASRNHSNHRWEHVQVDVPNDLGNKERLLIHTFVEPLLDLVAEIQNGTIFSFHLISELDVEIESTPPPFDITTEQSDEAYKHSPIFCSWKIPAYRLTIHVESWAEKDGGGFVDVFGKRGD